MCSHYLCQNNSNCHSAVYCIILKGNGMSPEVKFYLHLVLDECSFGTLVELILLALLQTLKIILLQEWESPIGKDMCLTVVKKNISHKNEKNLIFLLVILWWIVIWACFSLSRFGFFFSCQWLEILIHLNSLTHPYICSHS